MSNQEEKWMGLFLIAVCACLTIIICEVRYLEHKYPLPAEVKCLKK